MYLGGMPIRQKSRFWTTDRSWLLSPSKEKENKDQLITGLEATSKNEAGRDEKHFVVIATFFSSLFFYFALQLYLTL